MNKHQIIAYIKYGKLISEINDKITDSANRSDMIKFLIKFPRNLIYPNDIYLSINKNQGRFIFEITKPLNLSKIIYIDFDRKNNFEICPCNDWPYNKLDFFHITWASIDDIEYYVELYPNYFNKIIE